MALFVSLFSSELFSTTGNTSMGTPRIVFNTMNSSVITGLALSNDGSVLYSASRSPHH